MAHGLADIYQLFFKEYPFFLAKNEKDPQNSLLCIDETSDRFVSADEGTAFLTVKGNPAKILLKIIDWVKSNSPRPPKIESSLSTI